MGAGVLAVLPARLSGAPRAAWLFAGLLSLSLILGLLAGRQPADVPLGPGSGGVYTLLMTPVRAVAPDSGPLWANALLLAIAASVAAAGLARRTGGEGWGVVTLCVFGSATFAYLHVAGPQILLLTCAVAAFALVQRGGRDEERDLPDLYASDESGAVSARRWLAAGALLAVPVLESPAYAPLYLAASASAGPGRRLRSLSWLAAGGAVSALVWVALGMALGVGGWWSQPRSILPSAAPLAGLDPALFGRNVLFLLGGRNGGLIPYFAPVLLLLFLGASRATRGWVAGVAAALVALLVVSPFDLVDGGVATGAFLPLFGALWLLPRRPAGVGPRAATWLLGAALLFPLWLTAHREPSTPVSVAPYLPFEWTQRRIPPPGLQEGELWVRAVGRGLEEHGEGRLALEGGAVAELLVVLPAGLRTAYLEFGPEAGSALGVEGGALGQTTFLSSGGVLFEVAVDEPRARMPVWWAAGPHEYHLLRLSMPGGEKGKAYPFRMHGGRRGSDE